MLDTGPKVNSKCFRRARQPDRVTADPHGDGMRDRGVVQIYEIQDPREAEAMAALGVDHLGSVLLSKDDWKQEVIRDTVACVQRSGTRSSLIPLYREPDTIFRTLEYYAPDIVHFCDVLDTDHMHGFIALQESVRARFPDIAIMRSIPIAPPGKADMVPTLELAGALEAVSDWFLTDTLLLEHTNAIDSGQPVTGFVGITGDTCDWDMARRLVASAQIPVILAGGLGPENVADAIAHTRPAGVDSCTRTNAVDAEGRPVRFRKDPERVTRFIENSRCAPAWTQQS